MNRNILLGAVAVVLVGGIAVWAMNMGPEADMNGQDPAPANQEENAAPGTAEENAGPGAGVDLGAGVSVGEEAVPALKTFTVDGTPFKFSVPEMRVQRGDRVRVVFNNVQGTHDWVLEGYGVGTKVLQAGQSETVEFVADKAGSYEYYCSVGTHRQMGMKGTLIVQ